MPKDISKIIEQEYKLGFQTDIEEEQAPLSDLMKILSSNLNIIP